MSAQGFEHIKVQVLLRSSHLGLEQFARFRSDSPVSAQQVILCEDLPSRPLLLGARHVLEAGKPSHCHRYGAIARKPLGSALTIYSWLRVPGSHNEAAAVRAGDKGSDCEKGVNKDWGVSWDFDSHPPDAVLCLRVASSALLQTLAMILLKGAEQSAQIHNIVCSDLHFAEQFALSL